MPSLLSRVFGNLLLFSIVGGTNRYTNKLPASFSPPALQDLFISGQSTNPWTGAGTNVCYRIPSLLRLGDSNTLLAIASERLWELSETSFCSDEAGSNIVLRRSEVGGRHGRTWSFSFLQVTTYRRDTRSHCLTRQRARPLYFPTQMLPKPATARMNITLPKMAEGLGVILSLSIQMNRVYTEWALGMASNTHLAG